jgi:D-alanyl-D-alanine dipeptidase
MNSGYASQNDIVLSSDKRITSIPIIDNNEPMVDLTQQKEIAYSPASEREGNQNYTKVRKSVYDKLKQAQALLPVGLKLCVYEGYRSVGIQEKMFQKHFQQIQAANPSLPYDQLFAKTSEMIAPAKNVDGSENIPP